MTWKIKHKKLIPEVSEVPEVFCLLSLRKDKDDKQMMMRRSRMKKGILQKHNNTNNHHSLSSITESKSIYRLGHSDTFECHNCKQKGDKWFMEKHFCQGLVK